MLTAEAKLTETVLLRATKNLHPYYTQHIVPHQFLAILINKYRSLIIKFVDSM